MFQTGLMPKKLSLASLTFILLALSAGFARAQSSTTAAPAVNPDAWLTEVANNSSAPVKITEFFDYQCPFCAATMPALEEALKSYPGKVQLILRNSPLSIHPDSMLAHQAALAAAEQGKFWEMHRLLYANQKKLKPTNLLEYARQLNLNLDLFEQRLQDGFFKNAVQQDIALAGSLGVRGTPTFFINGQKLVGAQTTQRFKQAIDTALNPKAVAAAPTSPTLSVSGLDLSHAPVRGAKTAAITIIEFSDMQCPFCASVAPTMRELISEYPDNIKWVFKNFPLSFHADSPLAHRAVMAAAKQGKFWEMHDLIFSNQHAIKRDDLLAKASSLGLDMTLFVADLDSDKTRHLVEADIDEGQRLNVDGTPTFFINGKEYSGALTLARFKSIIDKNLGGAAADSSPAASTVAADEITLGPANAPVTLMWFSDLQSELTLKATLQVRQLMNAHTDKIRLVFRNRPLETHPGAMKLHEAALAANAQGKFWEMHDLIIANPHQDDEQTLLFYASRLGLDVKRFQHDLDTHKYRAIIEQDVTEAKHRAVLGTPVFFVNSTRIDGLPSQSTMESVVSKQLASKVQASAE